MTGDAAARSGPEHHSLSPAERRRWLLLCSLLLTLSCGLALRRLVLTDLAFAGIAATVGASLVVCGLYMTRGGRGRWTGLSAAVTGALWPLDWWGVQQGGIGPLVAWTIGGLRWIPLAYVCLTYPSDLPHTRRARNLLMASAALFGPGNVLLILLSRPEWNGFLADAWWPGALASRPVYLVASAIYGAGTVVVALGCGGVVLGRLRAAARVDRLVLFPSLIGMFISGLIAACAKGMQSIVLTPAAWKYDCLVTALGMLAVPASLLWSSLRFSIARMTVVETITRLSQPATVEKVRAALATALRDDSLEIILGPIDLPDSSRDQEPPLDGAHELPRVSIPVGRPGSPAAGVIVTDSRLQVYPEMLQAAAAAVSFPLENARMNADLRAALQETRESRARIYEAQVTERQRIERNLHDGAQQRLLAIGVQLEQLRITTTEPGIKQLVRDLKRDLQGALNEIRDLARGLHPTVLHEGGLDLAIADAAEGLPFRTEIRFSASDLSNAQQTAIYYFVCETLANATKHASASLVRIDVQQTADLTRVSVSDDGRGTAILNRNGGLRGMADRMEALGGQLSVDSAIGRGTTVQISLPRAQPT